MKKKKIILLLIIILNFSCRKTNENSEKLPASNKAKTTESKFIPKYGKLYFDYDEIQHYHINYDENYNENSIQKAKSETDDLILGDLILGDLPNNMNDLNFIENIEKIGFVKKNINKSNFAKLNEIFIEKTVEKSVHMKCLPIYRDILIFKKNKKIIGVTKICFSCLQNQIIGTNANTENFGQNGDYMKLKNILIN